MTLKKNGEARAVIMEYRLHSDFIPGFERKSGEQLTTGQC